MLFHCVTIIARYARLKAIGRFDWGCVAYMIPGFSMAAIDFFFPLLYLFLYVSNAGSIYAHHLAAIRRLQLIHVQEGQMLRHSSESQAAMQMQAAQTHQNAENVPKHISTTSYASTRCQLPRLLLPKLTSSSTSMHAAIILASTIPFYPARKQIVSNEEKKNSLKRMCCFPLA